MREDHYRRVAARFQDDFANMWRIEAGRHLHQAILDLVQRHSLRGLDCVHLASALILEEARLQARLVFGCYDDRLNEAARREGLQILESQT